MAEFVGAFAASHAPLIARDWDKLSATSREIITSDFRELGRRLAAAKPDAMVILSPDHWTNSSWIICRASASASARSMKARPSRS